MGALSTSNSRKYLDINNKCSWFLGCNISPTYFEKMDEDELKLRCLDQLEVISKKRLLKVLDGQEMSSSSSESEHEEDSKNTTAKESGQQNVAVTYDPMPSSEVQVKVHSNDAFVTNEFSCWHVHLFIWHNL